MADNIRSSITAICFIAALAMTPVAPEGGNIVFLAASVAALWLMWPEGLRQIARPLVWMPALALLLVALAFMRSAGPAGLEGIAFFAPVLAIWPIMTLNAAPKSRIHLSLIGTLALCGAVGAAMMGLFDFMSTASPRAGGNVANPIHYADVALLTGFLATVGCMPKGFWVRAIHMLGPQAALAAIILSGTRGALVGLFGMIAAGLLAAAVLRLFSRRMLVVLLVNAAATCVTLVALYLLGVEGFFRALSPISDTVAGTIPADEATSLRIQMYLGGIRAFLEAPLFGHGPFNFTVVANQLADVPFNGSPHLHNDLIDMAASAGSLGLVAYALLMLAPLVELFRAPPSVQRSWSIVLVFTLVAGFAGLGLSNAMFGILSVTVSYAAICLVAAALADALAQVDSPTPPEVT